MASNQSSTGSVNEIEALSNFYDHFVLTLQKKGPNDVETVEAKEFFEAVYSLFKAGEAFDEELKALKVEEQASRRRMSSESISEDEMDEEWAGLGGGSDLSSDVNMAPADTPPSPMKHGERAASTSEIRRSERAKSVGIENSTETVQQASAGQETEAQGSISATAPCVPVPVELLERFLEELRNCVGGVPRTMHWVPLLELIEEANRRHPSQINWKHWFVLGTRGQDLQRPSDLDGAGLIPRFVRENGAPILRNAGAPLPAWLH